MSDPAGNPAAVPDATASPRARLVVALLVGMLAAAVHYANALPTPDIPNHHSDFAFPWQGARLLREGLNPYEHVGPGRTVDMEGPLVYPLPALLLVLPLTSLSVPVAGAVFIGMSFAALAYVLTRAGWFPLLVLGSFPAVFTMRTGQSAAMLSAALLAAPLAGVLVARPNIAVAFAFYRPTRRWLICAVVVGGALLILSFALLPTWLSDALAASQRPTRPDLSAGAQASLYRPPVLLPGGVIALLALLRWRRPEARLVAALACVPQTLVGYDLLPILCTVPNTLRQAFALTLSSHLVVVGHRLLGPHATGADSMRALGLAQIVCLFLPSVLMILRRPNEGELPDWLQQLVATSRRRQAPRADATRDLPTAVSRAARGDQAYRGEDIPTSGRGEH